MGLFVVVVLVVAGVVVLLCVAPGVLLSSSSSLSMMCRLFGLVPNSKCLNKKVHSFIKGKKSVHNLWTHFPTDLNSSKYLEWSFQVVGLSSIQTDLC